MDNVLQTRSSIYDRFHSDSTAQNYFNKQGNKDAFAAYYTSMYLIQDTGEAIYSHMKQGFSNDPMNAYIEFWGVMQAIIIQQDAICELYHAVTGKELVWSKLTAWVELRKTRNSCAGHPANQGRGVQAHRRSFIGRMGMTYENIKYEMWDADTEQTTFPKINLKKMIYEYDKEASSVLQDVLESIKP